MLVVVFYVLLLSRLKICEEIETVKESDKKESEKSSDKKEMSAEGAEYDLFSVPHSALLQTCRSKFQLADKYLLSINIVRVPKFFRFLYVSLRECKGGICNFIDKISYS